VVFEILTAAELLRSYHFLGEEREEVVRLEGESERSGQQRTTSDSDRMM
jgi:uncharacterized protein YndB with AHSA1/START domain